MTATLAVLAGVTVHPWWWWVATGASVAWLLGYAAARSALFARVELSTYEERGSGIGALITTVVALIVLALCLTSCDAHAAARFVRHADGRVTLMVEQSVAAAPVVLRFTLPSTQQGAPCADGAPLAWLDSARVVARKRGPTGPYVSSQWVAYLAQPDTLLAQRAVSWTRIGVPDSFIVAAADTGATGWVQVHGTRGWSSVCRFVGVGAR